MTRAGDGAAGVTVRRLARAQGRLDEGARWIERMNGLSHAAADSTSFWDYTSAFLGAVQSSYLILHDKKSSFRSTVERWIAGLSTEERDFVDYMSDRRNRDVHDLGLNPVHTVTRSIPVHGTLEGMTPPRPAAAPPPTMGEWRFKHRLNGQYPEVIPACTRFLELGRQMVRFCESEGQAET